MFLLVMAVTAGGIAVFVTGAVRDITLEERGARQADDAKALAQLLTADLANELENFKVRAETIDQLALAANLSVLQRLLDRVQQTIPEYAWIGFADSDGRIMAATGGTSVGEWADGRPWFQSGRQGPTIIDLHGSIVPAQPFNPLGGERLQLVDLAHPVRDKSGSLTGVLAARLDERWLQSRLARYPFSVYGEPSEKRHSVVDTNGLARIGAGVQQYALDQIQNAGDSAGWFVFVDTAQVKWLVGFARHGGISGLQKQLEWTSVVQAPLTEIDRVAGPTQRTVLVAISVITLVASLTLWLLLRAASIPVRALMQQVEVARLNHREIETLSGLPEEFTQIQTSINDLIHSVQSHSQRLERALSELRESFSGVTDTFPGVLFKARLGADREGVFTYLSPSASLYLGVRGEVDQLPTAALYKNIMADSIAALAQAIDTQARASDAIDVTVPIIGGDGQLRHMRTRAKRRRLGGGSSIWDGVMVDVSDLIEARQQAAAADAAKSDFLASMSHEIRTPLNGIMGFAQLLLIEANDKKQQSDISRIIETTKMLTLLLNDILDYSKIEAGELKLEALPFDLYEVVSTCFALFDPEARRKGTRLSLQIDAAGGLLLIGDPTRLRQILINLMSNAVKFTHAGNIGLRVSTEISGGSECRLAISVSDTGIGMTEEQTSRVFKPFEQGDRAIYRQFGGSGLGLAIVKRLLVAMGSKIEVTSRPGAGSTFRFALSLPRAQPVPVQPSAALNPGDAAFDILVVDDVAINRELLRRLLEKKGHRVLEATGGDEAIESAKAQRFDIIFMDIEMPRTNGLEACQALRAVDGPNRLTPIVALTGYAFSGDIEKALKAGMTAHLAKPVQLEALSAMITTYCRKP